MNDMKRSAMLCLLVAGAFAISTVSCGDDGGGKGGAGSGAAATSGNPSGGNGGTPSSGAGAGAASGSKAGNGGNPAAGSGGKGNAGNPGAGTSGAGNGSGTGGAGTGSGGTSGGGAGTGGVPTGKNSVLERNGNPSRDGLFVQPGLTKAAVAKMALDADFKPMFSGNVWASPLYLENGPGGKGAFFAVTTKNDVFALDETTGATLWTHNIGSSPSSTGAGCGNINPVGIISTPVIDGDAKTIYVAGAIGTSGIMRHELHALSTDDGSPRSGWPVDVTKLKAGSLSFSAAVAAQNQRSALSLVNGIVYVAYGGHVGDCGAYHGWVVAVDAKDPTKTGAWATGGQGEAIWASAGLASDGKDVFAVTGNRTGGGGAHADSEQVVRLSGLAQFTKDNKNLFFPSSWQQMDSTDADFGGSNAIYITVPGSTPSNILAAVAKDGHFYLLDAANLGGSTPLADFMVSSGNMSIRTAPAAFPSANGVTVVITADSGAQGCPAGSGTGKKVMAIELASGSPPKPKVLWCAAQSGASTSSIVTTTDGKSEPIVWFTNGGKLNAVDGVTGELLFDGGDDTCSGNTKWTSPIAVKGRIVVSANNHFCSWSPH